MTTEEKELLLKDLSARLPYGVKCQIPGDKIYSIIRIEVDPIDRNLLDFGDEPETSLPMQYYLSEVKPYLFPLSSMTEEQIEEFNRLTDCLEYDRYDNWICSSCQHEYDDRNMDVYIPNLVSLSDFLIVLDWLNEHHFDYRGLIKKGLALDATGLDIY